MDLSAEPPAEPSSRKPSVLIAGLAALALVAGAGAVVFWPERAQPATATPIASASVAPSPSPTKKTPLEQVDALIDAQAQALLKGDEAAWLAPVDAKLHTRYRTIFRNLRALDITAADMAIDEKPKMSGAVMKARVWLNYCFSGIDCPAYSSFADRGAPKMINMVTWTPRDGSYVITGIGASGVDNDLQPTPWENTTLTFAQGKRVIVAAPKSQAANIKRILPLAEKAAGVADRYGKLLNNPQEKYRIYLADAKGWKTWYGRSAPPWSIGYHRPLNDAGSDIVLKAGTVMSNSDREITELIQHEMAHAVTLNGSRNWDYGADLWLSEGIAEYIGFQPKKPRNTYNRDELSYVQSRRGAIKTIAQPALTAKSDDLTVARLYSTGHFAAGCMAEKYGETKMLNFVQLVLGEGVAYDAASQAALGKPFKTVDKACVSWIRKQT